MSVLSEHEARTAWKYKPISGHFSTHPGLAGKVNSNGQFRPFMGLTVVFRLEKRIRQYLRSVGDYLEGRLGICCRIPCPWIPFT